VTKKPEESMTQNITEAIMGVSEELRYVTAERFAHALDEL
jgi:hypothetical protein